LPRLGVGRGATRPKALVAIGASGANHDENVIERMRQLGRLSHWQIIAPVWLLFAGKTKGEQTYWRRSVATRRRWLLVTIRADGASGRAALFPPTATHSSGHRQPVAGRRPLNLAAGGRAQAAHWQAGTLADI